MTTKIEKLEAQLEKVSRQISVKRTQPGGRAHLAKLTTRRAKIQRELIAELKN